MPRHGFHTEVRQPQGQPAVVALQLEASEARATEWETGIQQERFDAEDVGRHAAAALTVQTGVLGASAAAVRGFLEDSTAELPVQPLRTDMAGFAERQAVRVVEQDAGEAQ